jgi:DNA-binding NarL/FixJ family response regulator
VRIVIAEDHPFFRDGLRLALARDDRLHIIGESGDGRTALEQIRSLQPDVAILDIGLPELDGCEIVRQVRADRMPVEVIFLTIADDPEIFQQALEWDVKGYLLKDCTADEIVRCVHAVVRGQHFASPPMTSHLVARARAIDRFTETLPGLRALTTLERTVLRRIAAGRRSKEIAQELGIAPRTVDAHRTDIARKLGIRGKHALTRFAALHRDRL